MAIKDSVEIEESWKIILQEEFQKEYFQNIKSFLKEEIIAGKQIYPPGKLIFNAFNSTPFKKVKIVIIGQDPYHGPGQAMGLSFSVPKGVRVPASLKNVYKEMADDVYLPIPEHGDLSKWAKQGVFLLNAILTVEHKKPSSHKKIGWQKFTDAVISKLSENREGLIFMLWGNFARSKKDLIDSDKHLILEAVHPSPLARGGFFGCRHFSTANKYLLSKELEQIDWNV